MTKPKITTSTIHHVLFGPSDPVSSTAFTPATFSGATVAGATVVFVGSQIDMPSAPHEHVSGHASFTDVPGLTTVPGGWL